MRAHHGGPRRASRLHPPIGRPRRLTPPRRAQPAGAQRPADPGWMTGRPASCAAEASRASETMLFEEPETGCPDRLDIGPVATPMTSSELAPARTGLGRRTGPLAGMSPPW